MRIFERGFGWWGMGQELAGDCRRLSSGEVILWTEGQAKRRVNQKNMECFNTEVSQAT